MDTVDTANDPHQYVTDADGNRTHVLLTIEEYEELVDRLLDLQDAELVRQRREEGGEYLSLEDVKQRLGL